MTEQLFQGWTVLLLLLVSTVGVTSQCSNIELDDAVNYQCNGVYSNDGQEPCNDKPSYKHITTSSFYMYHTSGYWVVHNVWCSPGADDQGYLRVLSSANSPEWISYAEKWEENRGGWITNLEINTECTYDPNDPNDPYDGDGPYDDDDGDDDDLSPGAIAGICIGVLLLLALIALIVVLLMKKNKKDKQWKQTPPPFVLPPMTTAGNSQQPVNMGLAGPMHPQKGIAEFQYNQPQGSMYGQPGQPGLMYGQPGYTRAMNPYYIPPRADANYTTSPVEPQYHLGSSLDGSVSTGQGEYEDVTQMKRPH